MEAFSGAPEEFDAFVKEQLKVWEKLITDATRGNGKTD